MDRDQYGDPDHADGQDVQAINALHAAVDLRLLIQQEADQKADDHVGEELHAQRAGGHVQQKAGDRAIEQAIGAAQLNADQYDHHQRKRQQKAPVVKYGYDRGIQQHAQQDGQKRRNSFQQDRNLRSGRVNPMRPIRPQTG